MFKISHTYPFQSLCVFLYTIKNTVNHFSKCGPGIWVLAVPTLCDMWIVLHIFNQNFSLILGHSFLWPILAPHKKSEYRILHAYGGQNLDFTPAWKIHFFSRRPGGKLCFPCKCVENVYNFNICTWYKK